jgi:hypothetical protein
LLASCIAAATATGCGLLLDTDPQDPTLARDAAVGPDFGRADLGREDLGTTDLGAPEGGAVDPGSADGGADAGEATDAADRDTGVVDATLVDADDADDADASTDACGGCPVGQRCCVESLECYPATCADCCGGPVDLGVRDLGALDLGGADGGRLDGGRDAGRDLGSDPGLGDAGARDAGGMSCDPELPTACPIGTLCCRDSLTCVDFGACPAAAGPCGGACRAGEFCRTPDGFCSATGTCARREDGSGCAAVEVCGCDGMTYGDACVARSAGVSVYARGPCPI